MARRHKAHHEESGERWLITYADMITLLMAFFIMMYAMSIVNLNKFNELAVSVRSGFGGKAAEMHADSMGIASSTSPLPSVLPANSFELMTRIADSVRRSVGEGHKGDVEFLSEEGTVTIRLRADDVLFARGSADLTSRSKSVLNAIADAISGLPHHIRVEGHTCDLPISSARFSGNWELSSSRAIAVVLYLVRSAHFSPRRLSAAGYADTVPVAPNTTEANRAQNRRIDVVLVAGAGGNTGRRSEGGAEIIVPRIAPAPVRLDAEDRAPSAQASPGGSPK